MALESGWLFLGLVLLAIMVVVTLINKKQAVATSAATFVTIFLVLSIGYVYISNDLKIDSVGDFLDAGKIYFKWVFSIFGNVKAITAHAINLDWKNPDTNSTRADR